MSDKNFSCMRFGDVIQSFKDSFAPLRTVDPLNFSEVVTWSEMLRETGSKTMKTSSIQLARCLFELAIERVSPNVPHPIPLVSHPWCARYVDSEAPLSRRLEISIYLRRNQILSTGRREKVADPSVEKVRQDRKVNLFFLRTFSETSGLLA